MIPEEGEEEAEYDEVEERVKSELLAAMEAKNQVNPFKREDDY